MKTKRYSTEQIISILKEAEGDMPVKELCRKYGVSDATIYNWKSKYGGMSVSEAKLRAKSKKALCVGRAEPFELVLPAST